MRVRSSCAWLLVAIAAIAFGMTGCRGTVNAPAGNKNTSQSYPVRGVVVGTDPANGEVILKHDAIPGLMPAMTMPYHLEDPSALSELHPGDLITATLLADHDAAGPINLRLTNIVVIAQARPDYKPAVNYHVPAKGDEVPDFKLLNQSNHTIDLKQFRGKVVVMTFIYTRCPLADFCPRMSHNFAEIDKTLQSDPALYKNTHLLSVSFDPTYDTPKGPTQLRALPYGQLHQRKISALGVLSRALRRRAPFHEAVLRRRRNSRRKWNPATLALHRGHRQGWQDRRLLPHQRLDPG